MALDRLTQITSSGISSTSTIAVSAIAGSISGVVTATSLTVTGNVTSGMNVTGVVTATEFVGNVNSAGVSTFTTLKVGTGVTISAGVVTATSFKGDGSQLTGIGTNSGGSGIALTSLSVTVNAVGLSTVK